MANLNAVITGWGKCVPPAVLSNLDLSGFLDTDDAWITTRTGICERRVAHVGMIEMATVAAQHALAAAGCTPDDIDCIVVATATPDLLVPNTASRVQLALGNFSAAAMDINVGCCGFLYGLATANGLISTGVHRRVLLIGAERLTPIINWTQRDSAVLFGDGAGAVVLEASEQDAGVRSSFLACDPRPGEALMVADVGMPKSPPPAPAVLDLRFDGREVYRNAVPGMVKASRKAMARAAVEITDIDHVVPHQANLRIVEAVGKKLGVAPERVFTNLQKYGNTSAASIPLALTEALEQGVIVPGGLLLFTAFGAGLTSAAVVLTWSDRVTALQSSNAALAPCDQTALELIAPSLAFQRAALN